MPILDQYTQYQISDLIEACASYWELRGVAPSLPDTFVQAGSKAPQTSPETPVS
jgi:hypothetical protein